MDNLFVILIRVDCNVIYFPQVTNAVWPLLPSKRQTKIHSSITLLQFLCQPSFTHYVFFLSIFTPQDPQQSAVSHLILNLFFSCEPKMVTY